MFKLANAVMGSARIVAAMLASGVLASGVAVAGEAPVGAVACLGCHAGSARVVTPVPRIIGMDRAAIVKAMQDFRSGQRTGTVMDRIAKGFTDEEVQAIAAWYAAQR
jgi:cytochrome c553